MLSSSLPPFPSPYLKQSQSCPNWCNQRGYCTSPLEGGYCVCETGSKGDDCSLRYCPKAFDPITIDSNPTRRTIRLRTSVSPGGLLLGRLTFSFNTAEVLFNHHIKYYFSHPPLFNKHFDYTSHYISHRRSIITPP